MENEIINLVKKNGRTGDSQTLKRSFHGEKLGNGFLCYMRCYIYFLQKSDCGSASENISNFSSDEGPHKKISFSRLLIPVSKIIDEIVLIFTKSKCAFKIVF
jgi:hypothetical protein